MPTKIVSTASDYLKGEINTTDLAAITDQFGNHITFSSNNGRQIFKLNEIAIPVEIMENLISKVENGQRSNCQLVVRFGVTLPTQLDCRDPHDPVGNHLTAVLFLENSGSELLKEGDYVITTGFKEFVETSDSSGNKLGVQSVFEGACCPVITPGGH